ncbi:MAG TPA: peptidoglycan recognition family protein [Gemmatimonadaceae bacterium]|nr:peptidoglycan recognition family protein [Gemmatimonadaceae bacterium]
MTPTITWIGSTNKSAGRAGYRPEAIVIHIMEGSLRGTDQWFNTPKGPRNPNPVSAHYGIGRRGEIHQYVAEADTAWHAGRTTGHTWAGVKPGSSPNLYTIGIEHEGAATSAWPEAMYAASAWLVADVANRWAIPLDRRHVVGHREIYALKSCPGHVVDLDDLIDMALSVVLSDTLPNFVPAAGEVRTRSDLNIREGAPSSLAPRVRTAPRGALLRYAGWTSAGQTVHGNPHWYRDPDGNYFWAGATERPLPG